MLAQLVEHRYRKPAVTGSTPAHGIKSNLMKQIKELIADIKAISSFCFVKKYKKREITLH